MRLLLLVVLPLLLQHAAAEIFTSMADMELLLGAEGQVTTIIDEYIAAEQTRLQKLKDFAAEYLKRNEMVMRKTSGQDSLYMHNPVNAYLLIKRLTSDWAQVEYLMRNNLAEEFLANITNQRVVQKVRFPTQEDLNGAAAAIMRLQDVYRLDSRDIANGKIRGARDAETLNAQDCYELGRTAYNQGDYYHTLIWMQESLNRLEHENPPTIEESEVLEYLAFSLYQQGNIKRALHLTRRLAEIGSEKLYFSNSISSAPNHPRAAGNVKWYEEEMDKQGLKYNTAELPPVQNLRAGNSGVPERDAYEALCRGEIPMSPKTEAKLFCKYKRDRPFLWLAPIKVEVIHLNPMAVLFRDVLSDYEIEVIKSLAHPRVSLSKSTLGDID